MAILMNATLILTIISTLSLIGLAYIYIKNFMVIKSKFTIGLLIFALLFLLQNLVSLYFYLTRMEFYSAEAVIHVFILSLFQAIAFLILLKITWE